MNLMSQIDKRDSYKIFNQIAKTYDFLNRFLSLGIDIYWRHKMLNLINGPYLKVLDLATGTGDVAILMAKKWRDSKIIAMDLSEGMMDIGRKKAHDLSNITFKNGDGNNIPLEDNSLNLATVSFGIRNFPSTLKGLQEMHRVLESDGKVAVLEFSLPKNNLIKNAYLFYFRKVLPFIGNLFSGHKNAYSYLNQSVEEYPYGKAFIQLMEEAGFHSCKAHPFTFGICTLYIGVKK